MPDVTKFGLVQKTTSKKTFFCPVSTTLPKTTDKSPSGKCLEVEQCDIVGSSLPSVHVTVTSLTVPLFMMMFSWMVDSTISVNATPFTLRDTSSENSWKRVVILLSHCKTYLAHKHPNEKRVQGRVRGVGETTLIL